MEVLMVLLVSISVKGVTSAGAFCHTSKGVWNEWCEDGCCGGTGFSSLYEYCCSREQSLATFTIVGILFFGGVLATIATIRCLKRSQSRRMTVAPVTATTVAYTRATNYGLQSQPQVPPPTYSPKGSKFQPHLPLSPSSYPPMGSNFQPHPPSMPPQYPPMGSSFQAHPPSMPPPYPPMGSSFQAQPASMPPPYPPMDSNAHSDPAYPPSPPTRRF